MMDTEGKGQISFSEFKLIMDSTQRVVNFVDEFIRFILLTPSITHNGSGSVVFQDEIIRVSFFSILLNIIETL